MENQHRIITGYRDLSQTEIDLMNEIKAKGVEIEALIAKVEQHICDQTSATAEMPPGAERTAEQARLGNAQPHQWLSLGRVNVQVGFMELIRSVAQPTKFC